MSKALPLALLASALFVAIYLVLALNGVAFHYEAGEAIGEISSWCERVSGGVFREPSNTLSNLGFMVSGLLMLKVLSAEGESDSAAKNTFTGLNRLSVLYAVAVIYLGPGSWLMHGTHTAWGGWMDNLSMVMYILIPWLINVSAMGRWPPRQVLAIYSALVLVYGIGRAVNGWGLGINLDFFGLSIGFWVISEVLYRFWSQWLRVLSGFVGFVVAGVFGITPF